MNTETVLQFLLELAPLAWPLAVALVLLYLLRRVSNQVEPIVVGVVTGLASQAKSNALTYGLAIGYGLSAALQALAEQATALQWVYVAAAAKVANPFIVAMLAFAAKNSLGDKSAGTTPSTVSTAPFPVAPKPGAQQ